MSHLGASTSTSVGGGAGGAVGEDGEDGGVVTASSPFDLLPDELLSLILSHVADDRPRRHCPRFIINKRIARLALPHLATSLSPDAKVQPRLLQRLLLRPAMHPHVRGFYATIPDSSALLSYESAILQLFVNLTALSYEGNFGTAATVLPPPFTDALRSLKHLRSLDLRAEAKLAFEDNAFSVGRDLPLLRHLGLVWDSEEASITRQLLRDPCPNLKSILLLDASPTEPYRHLPWSTLEDVVVTLPYRAAGTSAALELLEGIAAAAEAEPSQLPLRHFRLEELIFGPPDVDIVSNSDAVALLKVLDAVRVPRLSLRLHGNINGLAGLPVLQAVERLSLELESGEFTRRTVFADFTAFLRRFPSLAELVISGGHFHSDYRQYYNDPPRTPPSTSYTPPSTDFFAAHPALLTFLLHLRTTTITRFVWEQIDDIRHCWQRGGLEEDFTVETYRY